MSYLKYILQRNFLVNKRSLIEKLAKTEMDTPEIKEFNRFVKNND